MKGNKGEWSEIYTFLKISAEGVLFGGDENLNKIDHIFYPVLSIIREEQTNNYYYNQEDTTVRVVKDDGTEVLSVDKAIFGQKSKELLDILVHSSGRSFEFPSIEEFLEEVNVSRLKSDSSNKRDITIKVHDLSTHSEPTLGFSIKSRLGGSSTLLNPGEATNFIYEVQHINNDIIDQINSIQTRSKIKDRVKFLTNSKTTTKFKKIESSNFQLNLQMIDTLLPEMLGIMLFYYYGGLATKLRDLVDLLEEKNPLQFDQSSNHRFYEYKIKNFLTDVALGMTPQRGWTGVYDATGGYIVVKEDGEIVCYHIYNRNEFQEYLLNHTYLDTPSSTRYNFGKAFGECDKVYIKLNLQIRFM
ncbi:HpaII family restriction endonuclease [Ornithinibacillus contaminans]|uniref:HpaII family restriction endonuclease n=1 Tax=Ornithinibacillus contaminans TaxID=694055 RepID=UPI00064DE1BE|nr:HpaII family restriction endonuclease [Ornithinibacillus contaminans]